jgi:hypothetical protein
MIKKRALLFDKINILIIILCYLVKPFFSKVFFRYSKSNFNNKYFGNYFVQIGFKEKDGSLFNKSYFLKKFLIKKFIFKNFDENIFFINFCKFISLNEKKINKVIFTLENYLYNNKILCIDTSSYIYSKKFLTEYSIFYLPENISSYLLLSKINKKFFKVISFLAYLKIIKYVFLSIYEMLKKNFFKIKVILKDSKKKENTELVKNHIGYFPHKSLRYGSFFSKTFFYKNEKNSILKKLGIDTIFFEKTDNLSGRYLGIYKNQKIIFNQKLPKKIIILFLKYLAFVKANKKYLKKNKFPIFTIFFLIFLKIEVFNNYLKRSKYKFFFFYNDYQIPNSLLISADLNNVKTISFQDRLTSYLYNHKVIVDYYFTCGEYFNKIFKKKYYHEKTETIGLLRSDLIDHKFIKDMNFLKKISEVRKSKKIISLILTTSTNEQKSNLYGEDGTSLESLNGVVNLIIELQKVCENKIYILIKFKDEKFFNHNSFYIFEKKINEFANVEFIKSKNISSANLISISDIILGKQSTIVEEALMKNKYALIFDSENFVSTFGFYRYNNFYVVKSLKKIVESILLLINEDVKYIENYNKKRKIFIENYLSDRGKINNFNTLKTKIVEYICEELKNKKI